MDEISIIGAILYRGLDPAGKQLSGLFTGSPVFRQLIDDNDLDVRKLLDRLMVALKYDLLAITHYAFVLMTLSIEHLNLLSSASTFLPSKPTHQLSGREPGRHHEIVIVACVGCSSVNHLVTYLVTFLVQSLPDHFSQPFTAHAISQLRQNCPGNSLMTSQPRNGSV